MNPILLIPARMASTRLPGKPLADIAGAPDDRARLGTGHGGRAGAGGGGGGGAGDRGRRWKAAGGQAVLTDPGLASGSDRIFAALKSAGPGGPP